jgi:hypothetical protein
MKEMSPETSTKVKMDGEINRVPLELVNP